jgi:hypothetical protein
MPAWSFDQDVEAVGEVVALCEEGGRIGAWLFE